LFHNVLRYVTLLWVKARLILQLFFFFFLLKTFFKNVMEYAFYETTIGAKWNVCGMFNEA
jgi:hypothetical protein